MRGKKINRFLNNNHHVQRIFSCFFLVKTSHDRLEKMCTLGEKNPFTHLTIHSVLMIQIRQFTSITKILHAKRGAEKFPYAKIPIPCTERPLCQNSNCQNTLDPGLECHEAHYCHFNNFFY